MPEYKVKQGDCLSSIAARYGLSWEKVWNHPKNARLKEQRNDPNVLYPGDILFIPDKEEKQESGVTEQKHKFRKQSVSAKMKVKLMINDEPRGDTPYKLCIDGIWNEGTRTTDGNGFVVETIPPNARTGKLIVGEAQEEYILNFGNIDPIDKISGVQARLNNLGFNCGPVDGIWGPKTEAGLKSFKRKYELGDSGQVDTAVRNKIKDVYGS